MGWILALFDDKMVHIFRDSSMVEQVAVKDSQLLLETAG